MTGMPWPKFLVLTAMGAALWVGVWTTADDVARRRTGTIYPIITRYGTYELAALALMAALLLMRLGVRRRFVRGCHRDR
jgi:membrane protein DedA with SNARE-associated domain